MTDLLQPPQSIDAEQAVLGAILKDPETWDTVAAVLKSDDFYVPKHGTIYAACLNLLSRQEPLDITTVANALLSTGDLGKVGGRVYMVELVEGVASTANAKSYARIVHEKAVARRLIEECNEIVRSAYEQSQPVSELLDHWQQRAFEFSGGKSTTGFSPLSDDNDAWLARVESLQSGAAQKDRIKTGFSELDLRVHGLCPGELVVIAGDTGQGKTQLALQIARDVAYSQGHHVGVLSLEMGKQELNARVQCAEAWIDNDSVETAGKLKADEFDRLVQAAQRTKDNHIWVDDSTLTSTLDLLANARRLKQQHDLRLLIVDYIQLMDSHASEETRERVVSGIARWMKVIAKELRIVVVALSQITAPGESKEPGITSLRESRAIGHHSDIVLMIHHDAGGRSWVILRKNRRGPSNKRIEMTFQRGQWAQIETHEPPTAYGGQYD